MRKQEYDAIIQANADLKRPKEEDLPSEFYVWILTFSETVAAYKLTGRPEGTNVDEIEALSKKLRDGITRVVEEA